MVLRVAGSNRLATLQKPRYWYRVYLICLLWISGLLYLFRLSQHLLAGWPIGWLLKCLFHPREPKKYWALPFTASSRNDSSLQKTGKDCEQWISLHCRYRRKDHQPGEPEEDHADDWRACGSFSAVRLSDEMPVISMFIGDKTIGKVKAAFHEWDWILFPKVMKQYTGNLKSELDLEAIVTKKYLFSSDKLEEVLYQIMSKEFRFVEIIGVLSVLSSAWYRYW